MKYQVIFHSGCYSCVDAECESYEQAQERRSELQAEMYMYGERNFYYEIKEVVEDNDDIFDADFNTLTGR